MQPTQRKRLKRHERRAAVVVYVAISLTTIMGMAALAVDIGTLYAAQSELQRSADAAALAAAAQLVSGTALATEADAIAAAEHYANINRVLGAEIQLNAATDIEMGHSVYDEELGRFLFEPADSNYDAVRVTLRRSEESAAGPVQSTFARVFGINSSNLHARATAVLVPRDIAVVIDISNSMCYDSQLRYYARTDGGNSNARDVWCALNGPEPARPYIPGLETETEYAGDTGPALGVISAWGTALVPGSYSASSDTGLWYVKKGANTSASAITQSLINRGYSSQERNILLNGGSHDSTTDYFRARCATLIGVAEWRSGLPGGRATGGDGDTKCELNELTWSSYPSYRVNSWTWLDYINAVDNELYNGGSDSAFRYRYGPKTFVDFLMEKQPQFNQTTVLWATPEEPIRAVKDATQTMMDVISALDSTDKVSLIVFATTARTEIPLTDNLQSIAETLYERQSGHYDRTTNIGGALGMAVSQLTGPNSRPNSRKVIMLMSDGVPNVGMGPTGEKPVSDGDPLAIDYAIDKANLAKDNGIQVFTVSVGYGVDRDLMQEIAAVGQGREFYAAGSPEEYHEELESIFRTLGGKRPVALIE